MKAPILPSFSPSRPSRQTGQTRGSCPPSTGAGKKCEPSSRSSVVSTWVIVRSLVPLTATSKAVQKSRNTVFQSILPSEISSSWFSSSAVKLYST